MEKYLNFFPQTILNVYVFECIKNYIIFGITFSNCTSGNQIADKILIHIRYAIKVRTLYALRIFFEKVLNFYLKIRSKIVLNLLDNTAVNICIAKMSRGYVR